MSYSKKLPFFALGLVFLYGGISKLFIMSPEAFANAMLVGGLGLDVGIAVFLAWVITIIELLGGIALLLGSCFPRGVKKVLLIALIVIILVAIVGIHLANQEWMTALKDLLIVSVLLSALGCAKCAGGVCNHPTKEQ